MTAGNLPDGTPLNTVSLRDYVEKQFELRDRANLVAVDAMNRRLEGMNEFRDTLRDQAARLTTREEHGSVCQRIEQMERWQSNMEGKASQSSVTMATLIAFAGLGLGIAGLAVNLLR